MTDRPNIIWLTLDSVRQDHTTMGGYERETTPRIQEIADASDGVAFSTAFAHARTSATSAPSLLSGQATTPRRCKVSTCASSDGSTPSASLPRTRSTRC